VSERANKTCRRCLRLKAHGHNWPEGFVCGRCFMRAVRLRGCCPSCGELRLLPGRHGELGPVCVACAGITTSFICSTCGHEAQQYYARTCLSCSLDRRLRQVLADSSGHVAPALEPLFKSLRSMANPVAGMNWLKKAEVEQRLRSLADGTRPLTHEGIDTMAGPQGREFLRELLIDTGLLAPRDKYLAAFKTWCPRRLSTIADTATRNEISLYLAWRHTRNLTVRSEAGHLTAGATAAARDQTDAAVRFLGFVAERGLAACEVRQRDIDDWFTQASSPFRAADFISWAIQTRRCPRLELPPQPRSSSPDCPHGRVGEIVRRLLRDETIRLGDRVAGLIVLLFAQHVSRVAQLRLSDLAVLDGELFLNLGHDPIVVPEPAASLVSQYAAARWNMNTTNTQTEFLFPGRRPGEHIIAMQLRSRLGQLGITKAERQGSLSYLISEVPAPVVAKLTGYNPATTAAKAAQISTDWARYVTLKRASTD
jgi:hypothetical protein